MKRKYKYRPSPIVFATEGTIQFHVSVRVDMKEFADWTPERITAFFGGITRVLAAKSSGGKDGLEVKVKNEKAQIHP